MYAYLSTREFAKALGVSWQTVYNWVKSGKLAYVVLPSGQFRIPREEVERFSLHSLRQK